MADRGFISGASKRAAIIAATFATIFCLHEFGVVDPDEPMRLPLLGIVLKREAGELLLYIGVAISFASWAVKAWFESPFDETPEYAAIRAKENEVAGAREARDRENNSLGILETQLTDMNFGEAQTDKLMLRDESADLGYRIVKLDTQGLPQKIINQWELLVRTRDNHKRMLAKLRRRENELAKLRRARFGIRFHSWVAYVCAPAFVSVLALVSGLYIPWVLLRGLIPLP